MMKVLRKANRFIHMVGIRKRIDTHVEGADTANDFETTIRLIEDSLIANGDYNTAIDEYFRGNPDLAREVSNTLKEMGYDLFTSVGRGFNAIALGTSDNKVVRLAPRNEGERINNPDILSAERVQYSSGIKISILPRVVTTKQMLEEGNISAEDSIALAKNLQIKLAKQGICFWDMSRVNTAIRDDGSMVIIDARSAVPEKELKWWQKARFLGYGVTMKSLKATSEQDESKATETKTMPGDFSIHIEIDRSGRRNDMPGASISNVDKKVGPKSSGKEIIK